MTGFLVLVCVVVLVLINVPIAVALSIAAVAAMLATQGVDSLPNAPIALYHGATSFPLIAIPLFILAAAIMNIAIVDTRQPSGSGAAWRTRTRASCAAKKSAICGPARSTTAMANSGV